MNIFVDYVGHLDLYYSCYKLFEKRLGYTLYRPDGESYWKDHDVYTIFNLPHARIKFTNQGDYTLAHNTFDDSYHRLISLEKFISTDFDIIMCTTFENELPFYNLLKKYHPNAIFIRHIANIIEQPKIAKNIIAGVLTKFESDINCIRYHPEHHHRFFYDSNIKPDKIIKGVHNYIHPTGVQGTEEIYNNWKKYESGLEEFKFNFETSYWEEFPKNIQNSMFFWHTKGGGCCGYTARQALFCGKPLIVNKDYCKWYNTLALDYLTDGINCIDINPNLRSFEENIKIIREWSRDDIYKQKCEFGLEYTKNKINFENESENIKNWLKTL